MQSCDGSIRAEDWNKLMLCKLFFLMKFAFIVMMYEFSIPIWSFLKAIRCVFIHQLTYQEGLRTWGIVINACFGVGVSPYKILSSKMWCLFVTLGTFEVYQIWSISVSDIDHEMEHFFSSVCFQY